MNKLYKTAIIGGGASGLFCAVELLRGDNALNGEDIIIFERNDRVAKKLIATGNGQGNLCNAFMGREFYHGESGFINAFLKKEKEINIQKYLYDLGIPLYTENGGKMYPLSRQANSVSDNIRAFLQKNGVNIITNFKVEKIAKGVNFDIYGNDKEYMAKTVVLAVGGACGKQFGTDGTSYGLAEYFGHKKTALYPSLVQLKTSLYPIKGLKGIKELARVTAFDGDYPLKASVGDLLFTDFGLSGSAIFSVSGSLAKAKKPYVLVEFLPFLSSEETEKIINDKIANTPYLNKEEMLSGIVNKKLGERIIKTSNAKTVKELVYALKNYRIEVTGSLGFNYAQVTKGGIDTDDIRPETFESKLCPNLYLTGEMVDIDGDCGGYNLTFAFISGILAAKNIKNK